VRVTSHSDAPVIDVSEIFSEVCSELSKSLQAECSSLVDAEGLDPGLVSQIRLVLQDVINGLSGQLSSVVKRCRETHAVSLNDLSVRVGRQRADRGVHPAESLRAATLLFDTALPVLVRKLPRTAESSPFLVSRLLHEAVMSRVAVAALSYVSFLLEKVRASRQEERQRIARELHDRVLHSLGFTLQQIDLYMYYADNNPEMASQKLDTVLTQLREAVHTVQWISAELRRSVSSEGVERSLRSYLQVHAHPDIRITFTTVGDLLDLPPVVAEELYLTLREAIRNALRHAKPSALEVSLSADQNRILASVTDDGCGFDSESPLNEGGGMPSMRERARLLNGEVTVSSVPGSGTSVTVRVPLLGVAL
jgi:signal transduction histidine kinase